MVASRRIGRGDIWLVTLDPTVGSEIQKTRPCVIVSPDDMHDHLRTVLAAPLTSGSRAAPFRVATDFGGRQGLILLDQIRLLDKVRLVKKLGALDATTLGTTLTILQSIFAE